MFTCNPLRHLTVYATVTDGEPLVTAVCHGFSRRCPGESGGVPSLSPEDYHATARLGI